MANDSARRRVPVYLTDEEAQVLQILAGHAGRSKSNFLAHLIRQEGARLGMALQQRHADATEAAGKRKLTAVPPK